MTDNEKKSSLLNKEQLLMATGAVPVYDKKGCCFTSVQTDSRNVTPGTLFVPLRGENQNGHKYIPQALEKGASVVFVDEKEIRENGEYYSSLCEKYPEAAFYCVENNLHALQDAAEAYVAQFPDLIKISITGSSGKTTTKEMLASVLRQHFGKEGLICTEGNLNSETGLPLSVFKIKGTEKVGVFEMGMNRVDEIGEISKVLKSKYGIISNIGNAHIGILGSRKNIALEKRKSFNYIPVDGAAFIPVDDDFADFCTENVKGKVVKYGVSCAAASGVEFIKDDGLAGTVFSVDGVVVKLPLSGKYNYQNALGVIALAKELGVTADEIKAGLEGISAVSGRMETKEIKTVTGKNVRLIADCYNANPDSMGKVIEFCGELETEGASATGSARKVFVLGDMKELGDKAAAEHRGVAQKVIAAGADYVCLVGPEMKNAADYLEENKYHSYSYFKANDEAGSKQIAEKLLSVLDNGDILLLKGSHSMALETIIPLLEGGAE